MRTEKKVRMLERIRRAFWTIDRLDGLKGCPTSASEERMERKEKEEEMVKYSFCQRDEHKSAGRQERESQGERRTKTEEDLLKNSDKSWSWAISWAERFEEIAALWGPLLLGRNVCQWAYEQTSQRLFSVRLWCHGEDRGIRDGAERGSEDGKGDGRDLESAPCRIIRKTKSCLSTL
jgi:hypothetical protein